MTKVPEIICGTFRRIEDGALFKGPLVRDQDHRKEKRMSTNYVVSYNGPSTGDCKMCGALLTGERCLSCGARREQKQHEVIEGLRDLLEYLPTKLPGRELLTWQLNQAYRRGVCAGTGPVTDEERRQHRELVDFFPPPVDKFLSARRAALVGKERTPEERVTISSIGHPAHSDIRNYVVLLDGKPYHEFTDHEGDAEKKATLLRRGLIAALTPETHTNGNGAAEGNKCT